MTILEAQGTVARLKAAYPSAKPLDEITSDLYTETLMRMEAQDVYPACEAMVSTLKFFPSIAEITEAVTAIRDADGADIEDISIDGEFLFNLFKNPNYDYMGIQWQTHLSEEKND